MDFLSRTNYEMHREHLRSQRLRLSIFEKSYPEILGKTCREILRLPIKRTEREAAAALKADVLAHELFFDSFSTPYRSSERVREAYGSEANFIYQLYRAAEGADGFLFIQPDRRGTPILKACHTPLEGYLSAVTPTLAIDLCEHAYFYDYGFDKASYLKNALASIDLSRL